MLITTILLCVMLLPVLTVTIIDFLIPLLPQIPNSVLLFFERFVTSWWFVLSVAASIISSIILLSGIV